MRPLIDVAKDLALAHRATDPATTTIKLFPNGNEIHLLEVSGSAPTTGEVIAFPFGPDPTSGVDYPSVVILLSQNEWRDVNIGTLSLPQGWDLDTAADL
jgi:hypothetical protein